MSKTYTKEEVREVIQAYREHAWVNGLSSTDTLKWLEDRGFMDEPKNVILGERKQYSVKDEIERKEREVESKNVEAYKLCCKEVLERSSTAQEYIDSLSKVDAKEYIDKVNNAEASGKDNRHFTTLDGCNDYYTAPAPASLDKVWKAIDKLERRITSTRGIGGTLHHINRTKIHAIEKDIATLITDKIVRDMKWYQWWR